MRGKSWLAAVVLLCSASGAPAKEANVAVCVAQIEVLAMMLPPPASDAAGGNAQAFHDLRQTRERVAGVLSRMERGDSGAFAPLDAAWAKLDADIAGLVSSEHAIADVAEAAADLDARLPVATARLDEMAKLLAAGSSGSRQQVLLAGRATLLVQDMLRETREILAGGEQALTAAAHLERDARSYRVLVEGLLHGSSELDVSVAAGGSHAILEDLLNQWNELDAPVSKLVDGGSVLQQAHAAADQVRVDSLTIVAQGDALVRKLGY